MDINPGERIGIVGRCVFFALCVCSLFSPSPPLNPLFIPILSPSPTVLVLESPRSFSPSFDSWRRRAVPSKWTVSTREKWEPKTFVADSVSSPRLERGKESGTGGTKNEGKFSGERPRSFETLQSTLRKSWRRIGRQIREVDLSLLLFWEHFSSYDPSPSIPYPSFPLLASPPLSRTLSSSRVPCVSIWTRSTSTPIMTSGGPWSVRIWLLKYAACLR